jgi:hypothetical protein
MIGWEQLLVCAVQTLDCHKQALYPQQLPSNPTVCGCSKLHSAHAELDSVIVVQQDLARYKVAHNQVSTRHAELLNIAHGMACTNCLRRAHL